MWCFGGEIVVECVAIVVGRQSFVWWLKICQVFEIYFWVGVDGMRKSAVLGTAHRGTKQLFIL